MPKTRGSYPKGTSGNPAGKPKGAKDKRPRGLVARIVTEALTQGEQEAVLAYRRAVANPRLVSGALETGARVLKEIGPNADPAGGRPIYITWISNVDPLALRRAAPRALNAKVRTVLPSGGMSRGPA